jgi:hypothetical protein
MVCMLAQFNQFPLQSGLLDELVQDWVVVML